MSDIDDKALKLIGIAKKGGLVVAGRSAAERRIKRGKLLILATDLSRRTKEKWLRDARFYGLDVIQKWSMAELGDALGRKPVGVVLILDKGIAEKLKETLKNPSG